MVNCFVTWQRLCNIQTLPNFTFEPIPYPLYSPELARCDFSFSLQLEVNFSCDLKVNHYTFGRWGEGSCQVLGSRKVGRFFIDKMQVPYWKYKFMILELKNCTSIFVQSCYLFLLMIYKHMSILVFAKLFYLLFIFYLSFYQTLRFNVRRFVDE